MGTGNGGSLPARAAARPAARRRAWASPSSRATWTCRPPGTITHIDDGRVYAFGHPFYNLGPTQFPMKKAYVYSVFPSLYQSWKISAAGEPVGTIDQDRTTAIAGPARARRRA